MWAADHGCEASRTESAWSARCFFSTLHRLGCLRIVHGILAQRLTSLARVLLTLMKMVSIVNPRMNLDSTTRFQTAKNFGSMPQWWPWKAEANVSKGTLPSRNSCNDPKSTARKSFASGHPGSSEDLSTYWKSLKIGWGAYNNIKYTQHSYKERHTYIHTWKHHDCLHTLKP